MRVLEPPEFYAWLSEHMNRVDPAWIEEGWQAGIPEETEALSAILGPGENRAILDPSCGDGRQTIPLAHLGWRVTASDITAESLGAAQRRADRDGLAIDFRICDIRDLAQRFRGEFDWVLSCFALDNIISDEGIQQAVDGMFSVLKPGGKCYLRLRDFDNILRAKPRYEFREERAVPHGRVIRLEDWDFEGDKYAIYILVFLREDVRKSGYRWETEAAGLRRRALRKAELERLLNQAGFQRVEYLPQPSPWAPYEVVATKAG